MYPVLFEIGGFPIQSFGVLCALGVLAAGQVASRTFERAGMTRDNGIRAVVWCMVAGLVGSKLWWLAEQAARGTLGSLSDGLFSAGGITWYGGLLAGTGAALAFSRVQALPLRRVVDALAPAAAMGQAFGRVGCFLVGDDYGRTSDVPWAIAFPEGLPPTLEPVHPTQLYEVAWLVPVSIWLVWRLGLGLGPGPGRGRSPSVLGEYLVLTGVGRLWIETLRVNPTLLGPFTNAQLVALGCIATGAALWIVLRRRDAAAPA
ncbi:MAG: prolipoprotein diacylglyceryl transferase [Proteobacteria bacterium]|nr:prolipoprotein diacylglyceryl transferase [Pseudomonadota bacterium]